jgi:hypothetical protein
MRLDIPPLAARMVLQAAACDPKRVVNRKLEIPVRNSHLQALLHLRAACLANPFAQTWFVLDYQLRPGQGQVDAYVIEVAFSVVPVWRLDGHTAAHDLAIEGLQLLCLGAN